jgi:hypothetical protein
MRGSLVLLAPRHRPHRERAAGDQEHPFRWRRRGLALSLQGVRDRRGSRGSRHGRSDGPRRAPVRPGHPCQACVQPRLRARNGHRRPRRARNRRGRRRTPPGVAAERKQRRSEKRREKW